MIRRHSRPSIRSRSVAEELLAASARRLLLETGMFTPPYDPWKVAEYLRIPIREVAMSASGVDGYVDYVDDWPAIVLNSDAPWMRRRFTLGHELAHALLMLRMKRDDGIKLGLKRYAHGTTPAVGSRSDPEEERLCDGFAAALLMPEGDVREYWRRRAITAQAIFECATFFEVSLFTACARSVKILPYSNASYWQRRPWPMTEWERGLSISRTVWDSLGEFVESVFAAYPQHSVTKSFDEFHLHADASVRGRDCLLLVVSRGTCESSQAVRPALSQKLTQEHLPGF
jgi:Zn-dependent peptidase ImmA (M78 family)